MNNEALVAFQAWEAGRVPNTAYSWAVAAWDAQQYVIDQLRADIAAEEVSKQTYIAEWQERFKQLNNELELRKEEVAYLRNRLNIDCYGNPLETA